MGIRVTKVCGYGLTDVQYDPDSYTVTDPRINNDSIFIGGKNTDDGYENLYSKAASNNYREWAKARQKARDDASDRTEFSMDGIDLGKENNEKRSLSRCVHYGMEYMDANVLLIKPFSCTHWERHDDTIDWLLENERFRNNPDLPMNHTLSLSNGIYPYSDTWMDKRTGERIKGDAAHYLRILGGKFDKIGDLGSELVNQAYGMTPAEAAENIVPLVPIEIRDIAEYGKLFTNDDVWKELRPIIYTYWS
jgi:hypothetical protein